MKKFVTVLAAMLVSSSSFATTFGQTAPLPATYDTGETLTGYYGTVIGRVFGKNDSRSNLVELNLDGTLATAAYGAPGWYYGSEKLTSVWEMKDRGYTSPPFQPNVAPVWVAHYTTKDCKGVPYADAANVPVRAMVWSVNGSQSAPGFAANVTLIYPKQPYSTLEMKSAKDTDGVCRTWTHGLYTGETKYYKIDFYSIPFKVK